MTPNPTNKYMHHTKTYIIVYIYTDNIEDKL